MKKRILLMGMGLLFLHVLAAAPPGDTENRAFTHGIGAAAGFVTGYGLSYRYMGLPVGIQLTFAPYVREDTAYISTGLALFRRVYRGRNSDLFIYSGLHYHFSAYEESDGTSAGNNGTDVTEHRLNWGFGPGFEIHITENIVFNLMAGYAVYLSSEEPVSLNFTGETGIFFYF